MTIGVVWLAKASQFATILRLQQKMQKNLTILNMIRMNVDNVFFWR